MRSSSRTTRFSNLKTRTKKALKEQRDPAAAQLAETVAAANRKKGRALEKLKRRQKCKECPTVTCAQTDVFVTDVSVCAPYGIVAFKMSNALPADFQNG